MLRATNKTAPSVSKPEIQKSPALWYNAKIKVFTNAEGRTISTAYIAEVVIQEKFQGMGLFAVIFDVYNATLKTLRVDIDHLSIDSKMLFTAQLYSHQVNWPIEIVAKVEKSAFWTFATPSFGNEIERALVNSYLVRVCLANKQKPYDKGHRSYAYGIVEACVDIACVNHTGGREEG